MPYDFCVQPFKTLCRDCAFQFALPDSQNRPACGFKQSVISAVSPRISINFLSPIVRIGGWPDESSAIMMMPETAIYKNNSLVFGKNNIRTSRKRSDIFPVSKSPRKKIFPNALFRFRVFAPNTGHISASDFL